MNHRWSKEEEKWLIKNVKGITLKELTSRYNKKFNMKLSKSAIANRKNKLKLQSGITGGQFQKGHIPQNKGKTWDEYMSKESQERSRKTTFKKGSIPPNHREIGSERLDTDGYILVKTQDGQGHKNWTLKHRLVWQNMYGNIPPGYKIMFADGNKRNCDIKNLILVSDAEELIMNQNKFVKDNADLTKVGLNIARIIDRINKRKVK